MGVPAPPFCFWFMLMVQKKFKTQKSFFFSINIVTQFSRLKYNIINHFSCHPQHVMVKAHAALSFAVCCLPMPHIQRWPHPHQIRQKKKKKCTYSCNTPAVNINITNEILATFVLTYNLTVWLLEAEFCPVRTHWIDKCWTDKQSLCIVYLDTTIASMQ